MDIGCLPQKKAELETDYESAARMRKRVEWKGWKVTFLRKFIGWLETEEALRGQ